MRLLALAALLLLGGCNLVFSETPLFTEADRAGAPLFKTGVWVTPEPGCRFRAGAPVSSWPPCANPVTVEDGANPTIFGPDRSVTYQLANGDPLILQIGAKSPDEDRGGYYFLAGRPTRFDRAGQVTEMALWFVSCGPSPPAGHAENGALREVTLTPGPGLTIQGGNCLARDQAAVRQAAETSESLGEGPLLVRWARRR